uniref:Putative LOB domain-containing protein 36 n=2 Tax=Davidia involucrata TaxID=16924 RepID=A0A5B7B5Y3_DAVIN
MSSSNSPCAACKLLRRKCTEDCVLAPYFPPDQPQKFANVHRVFGASNVGKLLNELPAAQREDAVNSLAYEADARLRDPVYGCVGLISILQHNLKQVQHQLYYAKKELANYIGPSAMLPILQHPGLMPQPAPNNPSSSYNMTPKLGSHGTTPLVIRESQQQQQQQMLEAQQLAAIVAAREQQEMLRNYEQQQHELELVRFNSGFEPAGPVSASGFNQTTASLALGSDNPYQIPQHTHQLQLHPELLLQQQQQQRSGSEEGRSVGPSC